MLSPGQSPGILLLLLILKKSRRTVFASASSACAAGGLARFDTLLGNEDQCLCVRMHALSS